MRLFNRYMKPLPELRISDLSGRVANPAGEKSALLVSPYFTPSNLAGVMRTRLLASHLHEFGWNPVVVTVESRCYEEACDEASLALLPSHLRVKRTGALPTRLCRPLGFGDISLRAQWTLRRKVGELARENEPDILLATVLPGYTSLIGAWAKRKFGMPFVLDYQDPWVSDWGARQPRFSKAGLSHQLALYFEPKVVPFADAVTAVSDQTLDTLRERKLIRNGTPIEIIPIGADERDHNVATREGRSWIDCNEGVFRIAYLGTITDRMLASVRTLFRALRAILEQMPAGKAELHFIGTSAQPEGGDKHGLEALARQIGIGSCFRLEPRRVGYLDALRTMQNADLVLLLGSIDPHYTASKIFPCWLSGKPILALFHARSTINQLAAELGGVRVITYDEQSGAETRMNEMAGALRELIARRSDAVSLRNQSAFEPYSAGEVARRYAQLFDRVLEVKN